MTAETVITADIGAAPSPPRHYVVAQARTTSFRVSLQAGWTGFSPCDTDRIIHDLRRAPVSGRIELVLDRDHELRTVQLRTFFGVTLRLSDRVTALLTRRLKPDVTSIVALRADHDQHWTLIPEKG